MRGVTSRRAPREPGYLSEHPMQVTVVEWAQLQGLVLWPLLLLFAVPNGGKRPPREAARMKKEGQRRGVLDLCLPVPAAGFVGLFVEMKTADGRVSDDQKWWIRHLRHVGWRVEVCRSIEAACAVLREHALAAEKEKPRPGGEGASGAALEEAKPGAACSNREEGTDVIQPQKAPRARAKARG